VSRLAVSAGAVLAGVPIAACWRPSIAR